MQTASGKRAEVQRILRGLLEPTRVRAGCLAFTEETRLRAVPFATQSGAEGVVVVSQVTTPYERSEYYALVATAVLAVLVVAVSVWMALRVTRQALSPVTQMAERAADWSEDDLAHRFDLGPPTNELAALGETLDHLLDRVASAIRSEQRLTSELAHELRTPLTTIRGSADLALLRDVDDQDVRRDLEQISAAARDMSTAITTLLELARDGSTTSQSRTCTIRDVIAIVRTHWPEGELEMVDDTGASSARIAAPAQLVARVVMPLIDNAIRHASNRVVVSAKDDRDVVRLTVADDGPGVAEVIRDSLFEPGASGRTGGAGLGLGIAHRVARSIGGDIAVLHSESGASLEVTLPRR